MGTDVERFFFLHVMKTGGTSFVTQIQQNFPKGEQYPQPVTRQGQRVAEYMFLAPIRNLSEEQRDRIRLYCGHLPFLAADLIGRPVTTLTILRDPVDRIISHLRHIKRSPVVGGLTPAPQYADMRLEEIYEDPDRFTRFLHNYQVKLFAIGEQDGINSSVAALDVDAAHLETAKRNLDRVDVLGLNARFDEFLDTVVTRFGWDVLPGPKKNVSDEGWNVDASFRRRIAEDNQADVAFYEYALEQYDQRSTRRR